jgi:prevent-host-death family protein
MKISAREFNRNSSEVLAAVEHGAVVTVTRNGRPVAVLSPTGTGSSTLHLSDSPEQ